VRQLPRIADDVDDFYEFEPESAELPIIVEAQAPDGMTNDHFSHEIRPRATGTGTSFQTKYELQGGGFVMPAGPTMNTAVIFLPGTPECNGARDYLNGTPSQMSDASISFMQAFILRNLFSVPITAALVGVLLGIQASLQYVTSNEGGVFGDHGRSRFEGPVFIEAIHKQFFNFAKGFQPSIYRMTSGLLFKYMSRPDINVLIALFTANLQTAIVNVTAIITATIAVFNQALIIPHSIKKHRDHPGIITRHYVKAIFMHNTTGEPYYWDLYADDSTLICTVRIPSNSCLFISEYALGMKGIQRPI